MMHQFPAPEARRRAPASARRRLAATTALGMGATLSLVMFAGEARAQNECGVAIAGQVTCTAAGNPYDAGITYAPVGDFALDTTADAEVTGPVSIVQNTAPGNVVVDHRGRIEVAAEGATALRIDGGDVALTLDGDVISTSPIIPPVLDDGGNEVSPSVAPAGIIVDARTGNATIVNNATVSTSGDEAPTIRTTAAGNLSFRNAGTVASSGFSGPAGLVAVDLAAGGNLTFVNDGAITADNVGGIRVQAGGNVDWTNTGSITVSSRGSPRGVEINAGGNVTLAVSGTIEAPDIVGFRVVSGGEVTGSVTGVTGSPSSGAVQVEASGRVDLDIGTLRFGGVSASSTTSSVTLRADSLTAIGSPAIRATAALAADVALTGTIAGDVDLTSGTQASLNIGQDANVTGDVRYSQADGAGSIAIVNQGTLFGSVSLDGSGNSFVNSGTFILGSQSRLGANNLAENVFTNTGTLRLTRTNNLDPTFAATISGVTTFRNSGSIDLRNGVGGDTLTLSGSANAAGGVDPVTFVGSGASTVFLEVDSRGLVSASDRLVVDGAVTGRTRVAVSAIGSPTFFPRQVLVQGGVGTTADALEIVGAPTDTPLVAFTTAFDPATRSFGITATPGDALARIVRVNEGASQLWYRSADTVAAHWSEGRDARSGGYAAGGGRVWGAIYGQATRRRGDTATALFGVIRTVDAGYRQDTFGGQIGYDAVGDANEDGISVGATGGYQNSSLNLAGSDDRTRFDVGNAGLLLGFRTGGLFLNTLAKFDYLWLRYRAGAGGELADRVNGSTYGGQGELGYRFGTTGLYVEPVATLAYARTNLDRIRLGDVRIDFGTFEGFRGKAGARIGGRFDIGGGATAVAYAQGNYVREFAGDGRTRFTLAFVDADIGNPRLPDYGEGRLGVTIGNARGVSGFVEGFGMAGRGYRGGGGRAGLRIPL